MGYRLVCLDAGFTILSPRRTLGESLASVLEQRGHPVTQEDLRRAWEVADRWFWDQYHRPGNRTWGDDAAIEATWRAYHTLMLSELGYADPEHDLIEAILGSQFSPDTWELYPDVEPALQQLREMPGLQLAVISDWGSNLAGILSGLGLDRYLDFVLASGAVGVAKPDPALFRMALDRSGASPDEGLMVGDSYRADVLGGRAAGMDSVLLRREDGAGELDPPPPDATVIASLAELPALVAAG
jgi:putative hydrolase of the HAD superfamily